MERDQISDIRPPKKSNIRYQTPQKSNIRYVVFAKIRYLALKNQISGFKKSDIRYKTQKKVNYQISHPLKNKISDIKVPPPPQEKCPFIRRIFICKCPLKKGVNLLDGYLKAKCPTKKGVCRRFYYINSHL